MAGWTAYCAPGRRAHAAIVLALKGEDVTGIKENQVLQGSDIILVNDAAIEEAYKADWSFEMSLFRPAPPWLGTLLEDMARASWNQPSCVPLIGI